MNKQKSIKNMSGAAFMAAMALVSAPKAANANLLNVGYRNDGHETQAGVQVNVWDGASKVIDSTGTALYNTGSGVANIVGATGQAVGSVVGGVGQAAGSIIGATGQAGAGIVGTAVTPIGGHTCLDGGCRHYTPQVGYATYPVARTMAYPTAQQVVRPTYYSTAPAVRTVVANPDVVYQSIRPQMSVVKPAYMTYQTAPVQQVPGTVTVKETYDAYSYQTEDSSVSQTVRTRFEDNPAAGYRSKETHAKKITRRVYYTAEY